MEVPHTLSLEHYLQGTLCFYGPVLIYFLLEKPYGVVGQMHRPWGQDAWVCIYHFLAG